jgi:uncharacterized protein (DUF1697 family)
MMAIRRYAAFLRGVSPMNAKMPQLKKSFEAAGFKDVKTFLSSGNVVFSAPSTSEAVLEKKAWQAMERELGKPFRAFVRSLDALREMLDSDPYAALKLAPGAKRVVTFLAEEPGTKFSFPIKLEEARILALKGREAFSAYVPGPNGPVFMTLIQKTFGEEVTTRTWDTVKRIVGDHPR